MVKEKEDIANEKMATTSWGENKEERLFAVRQAKTIGGRVAMFEDSPKALLS